MKTTTPASWPRWPSVTPQPPRSGCGVTPSARPGSCADCSGPSRSAALGPAALQAGAVIGRLALARGLGPRPRLGVDQQAADLGRGDDVHPGQSGAFELVVLVVVDAEPGQLRGQRVDAVVEAAAAELSHAGGLGDRLGDQVVAALEQRRQQL